MRAPWNTLEIAKLSVSLCTPLVVALVGLFIQQELADQNRNWVRQQQLSERRLKIYTEIAKPLNNIYCFIKDVGTWKEQNPKAVIAYKRQVDTEMFSNQAIWSPSTFSAYVEFVEASFDLFQGVGQEPKIKTFAFQKKRLATWDETWAPMLTDEPDPSFEVKYQTLQDRLSGDIALTTQH